MIVLKRMGWMFVGVVIWIISGVIMPERHNYAKDKDGNCWQYFENTDLHSIKASKVIQVDCSTVKFVEDIK